MREPRDRVSENQAHRDRVSVDRGMEGQRRAKRGETGSCCVRGGQGGSYMGPRVDLSTICDEHLCNVKVSIIAGIVQRSPQRSPLILEAGMEYDAEGWP